MSKIKIKDIEGEASEISNLFKDLGCDLSSYISPNTIKKKVNPVFWIVAIIIFFVLACIIWCGLLNPSWYKVCVLSLFLLLGIVSLILHYNYDKWPITIIAIITGLCIVLVSLNVYSPQEMAKKVEKGTFEKVMSQ